MMLRALTATTRPSGHGVAVPGSTTAPGANFNRQTDAGAMFLARS